MTGSVVLQHEDFERTQTRRREFGANTLTRQQGDPCSNGQTKKPFEHSADRPAPYST